MLRVTLKKFIWHVCKNAHCEELTLDNHLIFYINVKQQLGFLIYIIDPFCKLFYEFPHFCLLKLKKYLKILSVRMNISKTNKYWFPILHTCINHNRAMNPVKFCQDQIQNGWLIVIFVASNWQNIWKFVCPTWMNIFPDNLHMHLLQCCYVSL